MESIQCYRMTRAWCCLQCCELLLNTQGVSEQSGSKTASSPIRIAPGVAVRVQTQDLWPERDKLFNRRLARHLGARQVGDQPICLTVASKEILMQHHFATVGQSPSSPVPVCVFFPRHAHCLQVPCSRQHGLRISYQVLSAEGHDGIVWSSHWPTWI